jgi:sec-independent protein translocase protein TatC
MVQPFFAPKYFIFTDLAEALSSTIYVCLVATFHLVIPFFFYQSWAFSIPGFFEQERKKITVSVFSIFIFLLLEGAFILIILLPEIFSFLFSFEIKKEILTIQLEARIQSYIHFTFCLYLYLLFLFQIPLIFFLLFRYKIVTAKNLSFYRKYFYFFSLLLAAFVSPPDMIYQLTIAFLLAFLYEIGIWLGFVYASTLFLHQQS